MSAELFGVWRLGTDGRAHYFLGGAALCGGRVRQTGGPAPKKVYRYLGGRHTVNPNTSHDCPDCTAMNFLRWLSVR